MKKNTPTTRPLILENLKLRPMSALDFEDAGLACVQNVRYHMGLLTAENLIVKIAKLQNPRGGMTTYYKCAGFERPDDVGDVVAWHKGREERRAEYLKAGARTYGAQRVKKKDRPHTQTRAACSTGDEDEDIEVRMLEIAKAKALAVRPFRCWMTLAFYGEPGAYVPDPDVLVRKYLEGVSA